MLLSQTGYHLLHRLGVDGVPQRRVLFHQALQRAADLALVAFLLYLDGHGQRRPGELGARQAHHTARRTQRVARLRGRQLGNGTDVARADLRRIRLLFSFHEHQLAHTFGLARAAVYHRRVRLERAADNLDIAHLTHKRVCYCFEYICAQRVFRLAGDLHFVSVAVRRNAPSAARCAGQQLFDVAQHHVRTRQRSGAAAEYRRDGARFNAYAHTLRQLLLREGLTLEEFLHQRVIGLGHSLAHGLDQPVLPMAVFGHRHFAGRAVDVAVRLGFDQVHKHAAAGLLDGHDHRTDGRAELRFQLFKYFIEIGMLGVDFRDVDHTALAVFQRQLVRLLRTDGEAAAAGHCNEHALGGADALVQTQLKIKQTRRVDQIYFYAVILDRRYGQRQGCAALGLLGVVIAYGVPVFHTAQAVGALGGKQQRFGEAGFPGAAVARYEDVSDVIVCVIHKQQPSFPPCAKRMAATYTKIVSQSRRFLKIML